MTKKCKDWLTLHRPSTPCLVIDLEEITNTFKLFKRTFPYTVPFYAVKANPASQILKCLDGLGSFFDAASINEINTCLKCYIDPAKISYGNTIKKEKDISLAYKLGIRVFVFDCIEELHKISRAAPKASVFCRVLVSNDGAMWPLNKKFGCTLETAKELIIEAKNLGLQPIGLSFHVGSQQTLASKWSDALKTVAPLYNIFSGQGSVMDTMNLGGGIPISYVEPALDIMEISKNIFNSVEKIFKNKKPKKIFMEPGRFLVGSSGIIETEIILITEKNDGKKFKWLYLDIGKFGGLAETEGEAIRYPIETVNNNYDDQVESFIICGPTCDSQDILYQQYQYALPKNLKIGDRLRIGSTGAYTSVYASNFNGIEKLDEYYI